MSEKEQDLAAETQQGDAIKTQPVYQQLVTPVEMQRSFYTSVNKVLRQGSLAFRKDRTLQRQMRFDPDIMGPLLSLQLGVACSDWTITPQADKMKDPEAIQKAAIIEKLVRGIPRITDFIRHLLDALWYGRSAVNIVYGRSEDMIYIRDWLPIHGDSVVSTELNQIGLKVGPRYYTQFSGGVDPDTDKINGTIIGWDSRVLPLDERQRATIVLHTYQAQGVDFDDPYEAENAYLGRGMRDLCWYYWSMKQAALQNWATYIERYSMGIRIGTYPIGNDQAKTEMETVMQNMLGDVSALMPRDPNATGDQPFDIKILEPNAGNAETFARMVEYLVGNIKEVILGQTGTSEAISTGMGSSVADEHAKTLNRQMQYVANGLAETMNREVIQPLYLHNFGHEGTIPQFTFSISKPNPEEYMKAVESFTKLGGRISEREARKVFGLAEPEDDEPVLQAPAEGGMAPLDVRPMGKEPEPLPDMDEQEPPSNEPPTKIKARKRGKKAFTRSKKKFSAGAETKWFAGETELGKGSGSRKIVSGAEFKAMFPTETSAFSFDTQRMAAINPQRQYWVGFVNGVAKPITRAVLWAAKPNKPLHKCNSKCKTANGGECNCECLGKNHGILRV